MILNEQWILKEQYYAPLILTREYGFIQIYLYVYICVCGDICYLVVNSMIPSFISVSIFFLIALICLVSFK